MPARSPSGSHPDAPQPCETGASERLWLFSGTGDGLTLAQELLLQGWQVRVSVVAEEAARAYPQHPDLELLVGPLGGCQGLHAALAGAKQTGRPFRAVIDATHPFACRISKTLRMGCAQAEMPLLVLNREDAAAVAPVADLIGLTDLQALQGQHLEGERLLLAIGARRLAEAVQASQGAVHHTRLLPRPLALQQALAAGLPPHRVACLQPPTAAVSLKDVDSTVEAALLRRWRITAILARQSGPPTELLWRGLAAIHGCRLLLLRQPRESGSLPGYSRGQLLAQLAAWRG
jgi:precorrin-6A/cobalt-precorrin-6A reductase